MSIKANKKTISRTKSSKSEKLKTLIIKNLTGIVEDTGAPANARASAARTLAEIAGVIGRHASTPAASDKSLAECSLEELEAQLASLPTGES